MNGNIDENKDAMEYLLDFQDIINSWELGFWQSRYDDCMEMIRTINISKPTEKIPYGFDKFGNILPEIVYMYGFNDFQDDIEVLQSSIIAQKHYLESGEYNLYNQEENLIKDISNTLELLETIKEIRRENPDFKIN